MSGGGASKERLNTLDVGLLVLRIGLGATCILHALPRAVGGPETWSHVGQAMGVVGITRFPVGWGALAVAAGLFGGVGLMLGVAVRVWAAALAVTAYIATVVSFSLGSNFPGASQTIELMIAFTALAIMGGGRLALWPRPSAPDRE